MKIAVPVAGFHEGNTGEYVHRALIAMGHESAILTPNEFSTSLDGNSFDYYLCVDSGETFCFREIAAVRSDLSDVGFWFIDFRHNKDRATRIPNDFENAAILSEHGGTIFQAQLEDVAFCLEKGLAKTSWLPMAADPYIWSDQPKASEKLYDLSFFGNVWDKGRAEALQLLLGSGLRFGFFGHGKVWKEQAAKVLRESIAGFNISSWYGEPYAYDINMRFFETLSCGTPVITNFVPSLLKLFPKLPSFVRCYNSIDEIMPTIQSAFRDPSFLISGQAARSWIESYGTYRLRMEEALKILTLQEVSRF